MSREEAKGYLVWSAAGLGEKHTAPLAPPMAMAVVCFSQHPSEECASARPRSLRARLRLMRGMSLQQLSKCVPWRESRDDDKLRLDSSIKDLAVGVCMDVWLWLHGADGVMVGVNGDREVASDRRRGDYDDLGDRCHPLAHTA